jgi:dTDP-4-amino-4,6-dideoxygalactose transaminase
LAPLAPRLVPLGRVAGCRPAWHLYVVSIDFAALGLGPGDRVVVPAITFAATANAARFVGADVVFADVDPATGLITATTLTEALRRADGPVRAVFPVHFAGQRAPMAELAAICRPRGIALVEDACHALGTRFDRPDGREGRVGEGGASDAVCFSFHAVKTVAMGEGGAVLTDDPARAAHLRRLRSHGVVRAAAEFQASAQAFDSDGTVNPWYYEMAELGFNYRASDIVCALGVSQLDKLARFVARRAALVAAYDRALAPLAPRLVPLGRVAGCRPAWHLYVVSIDFAALGRSRAQVMRALAARGIGTQVHYLPVHRHPYYQRLGPQPDLPGADAYYRGAVSLPLFPAMGDADLDRVVTALFEILA